MSLQSQSSTNSPEPDLHTSSEKERVLWETFREEHFEAVDQLPLAIHRQYSLVRELDERARSFLDQLQPLLRDYIEERLNAVRPPAPQPRKGCNKSLLTRIVRLSDDIVRASEENVNIALAVNNSVERHLRLLDHAVQEARLSLGNANPAPIHLPDLVVPRWSRTTRNSSSPLGNSDGERDMDVSPQTRGRKSRGKQWESSTSVTNQNRVAAGLPFALTPEDFFVDSSERLYCYCQEVSFGEMIACDNPKCEREWFHLACVGLEEPPKGKWFCEECSAKRKSRKK